MPTAGDWFRGSSGDLKVCADTTAHNTNVTSAAISALVASLIAFLLRNEYRSLIMNATVGR